MQTNLFSATNADLPLFSGTAPRAHESTFTPRPYHAQQRMNLDTPPRRDISGALAELENLRQSFTPHDREHTICQALAWGLSTARTIIPLEAVLFSGDIPALVDEINDAWDGEHYMSGALRTAQELYKQF